MIPGTQRFESLRAKLNEHRNTQHQLLAEILRAMRAAKSSIQSVGGQLVVEEQIDKAAVLQSAQTRLDHVERLLALWHERTAKTGDIDA